MTNLHAELVLQPGSRGEFARLARAWLTEARARLFPEFDRILALPAIGPAGGAAGGPAGGADASSGRDGEPPEDDAPWGPPGGVWARLVVRQQPQAIGGVGARYSQRAWRRTLDSLERDLPFQSSLEMMPLDAAGRPLTAGPPAVLTVQRSQFDPRWARFEAEAPDRLVGWAPGAGGPPAWAGFVQEQAAASGAQYGHVSDDATSHGTALERAVLGVTAEPPDIPRVRVLLRGYSWVTIVAAPLAARLGGAAALTASGAFYRVGALPGGQVFLQATPDLAEYEGAAVRRVFGVLAPVLRPGRPDPEAVSGDRVRLVLDTDAADAAGGTPGGVTGPADVTGPTDVTGGD
jgi:hypothetical protein